MAPSLFDPSSSMTAATMTETQPREYYSQGLRKRFRLDALKLSHPLDSTSSAIKGGEDIADGHGPYADISYKVDEAKYKARSDAVVKAGGLETQVPYGWPKRLEGPLVWSGSNQGSMDERELVLQLTDQDLVEVVQALHHFLGLDLDVTHVSRNTFPLPTLGRRLDDISENVYNGRGFAIVRGLDPASFSTRDFAITYLGISSYVAEKRGKQDQRGSMLLHVIEQDQGPDAPENPEKPFHTDTVCDCVCLVTQKCSIRGGRSIMASIATIYNELAATRPDILHVLARPDWPFDTHGRVPACYKRAILFHHEGRVMLNMARKLLTGDDSDNPRTKGIPGLTERQAEALDALHYIAEKHCVKQAMQEGDIRFMNNLALLHRREAFETGSDRHLIRLWLKNEQRCWALPLPLTIAWARVFEDDDRRECWDLEPVRVNGKILRVAGSCD